MAWFIHSFWIWWVSSFYLSSTLSKLRMHTLFWGTFFVSVCLLCLPAVSISWELCCAEHPWQLLKWADYSCVKVCASASHFPALRSRCRLTVTAVLGQEPGVHQPLVPASCRASSRGKGSAGPAGAGAMACCSWVLVCRLCAAGPWAVPRPAGETEHRHWHTECEKRLLQGSRLPLKSMGILSNKVHIKMEVFSFGLLGHGCQ